MKIDPLTGEVTAPVGGKEFRFQATIGRMAALEATLGTKNFGELFDRLIDGNIAAISETFDALCTSGNGKEFQAMAIGKVLPDAVAALTVAMANGLPPAEDAPKNGGAPKASGRRGRSGAK